MSSNYPEHFRNDPDYLALARAQKRLSFTLSALILILHALFIVGLVFTPDLFGTRIVRGTDFTVGLLAALVLMLLAFALTGYYLHRVRVRIDPLRRRLLEKRK